MLKIAIPNQELFDNESQMFIYIPSTTITLEHSLLSVSKWEAKWKKPFLSNTDKNPEEMLDYIRCMTVNTVNNKDVYYGITNEITKQVQDYIDDPMTATRFSDDKKKSKEVITSEIIYYWMIGLQIPFECEKWHLNRLLTLIKVCNEKNDPKKMSKKDAFSRQKALNEARRRAHKSRG